MIPVRKQAGDTLVEVVMAIAIFSVALASVYSVANVSYRSGINARERTQAAHLLQDQAERLRRYRDQLVVQNIDISSADIFTAANFPGSTAKASAPAAPAAGGAIPPGMYVGTSSSGRLQAIAGLSPNCYGLPTCQLTIYVTRQQNSTVPALGKITALVYVTWKSLNGGEDNVSSFQYSLTDTRPIQPCDASLAGGGC